MNNVSIIFKNKTTRIEKAEVTIDGKKFIVTGSKAKELAKLSNSDLPGIKKFIENLFCNTQ